MSKPLNVIIDVMFPPKCIACKQVLRVSESAEPSARCMCQSCLALWNAAKKESCPECLCPSELCLCSPESGPLKKYAIPKLVTYTPNIYNTQAKIILSMKRVNDKRAVSFIAHELLVSLCRYLKDEGISPDECVFTYVPRRRSAVGLYGFDQAKRLAYELSRICEGDFCSLFSRRGNSEQKKLTREQRTQNIKKSVKLKKEKTDAVKKRTVVLVDDLVTTGATLGVSASLLKRAGASRVVVCSVALARENKAK